ncbi:hypothetical protein BVRB_2g027960 [Beta vulgaris subsp. vulgaris]|nr:hypothetical protein BVRB_2g027960 [Beta vulgaris subsp. vulgaris]
MNTIPSTRIMPKSSIAIVVYLLLVFLLINSSADYDIDIAALIYNTLIQYRPAIRTMPNGLYIGDNHFGDVIGRSCEAYIRCGRVIDQDS